MMGQLWGAFLIILVVSNIATWWVTASKWNEIGKETVRTEVITGTIKALSLKSRLDRRMRLVNLRAAEGAISKQEQVRIKYGIALELINSHATTLDDCEVPQDVREALGEIR